MADSGTTIPWVGVPNRPCPSGGACSTRIELGPIVLGKLTGFRFSCPMGHTWEVAFRDAVSGSGHLEVGL